MKLGQTRHEDRSRATRYLAVARALLCTARDLETMGEPKYGNGLAIIAIHASYSGSFYTLEDGRDILQDLEQFAAWAEKRLANRPPT